MHSSSNSPLHNNVHMILPLVFCTFITLWLACASAHIETRYLENYGHFFDPASYYYLNIECYRKYVQEGLPSALTSELATNTKSPGRTIPYLLFAPQLLVHPLGHMVTLLPFLWVFLNLLFFTVYRLTKSSWLSVSAVSTFACIPFLYDAKLGIAAYWLDLAASLSMGCAALCLINYRRTPHAFWLGGFGTLSSVTAVFRYSAGFYTLTFAMIAVPVALLPSLLDRSTRAVALRSSLVCLLGSLPGLVFLIYFLGQNHAHYTACGYAFGATLFQSITWTANAIAHLLSTRLSILLTFLTAVGISSTIASARASHDLVQLKRGNAITFLCAWFPLSIALFTCVIVRAVNGYHPLVYFAPALVIAAFCSLRLPTAFFWNKGLPALITVFAVFTAGGAFKNALAIAEHPNETEVLHRKAEKVMVDSIVKTQAPSFAQFNEESLMPQVEAFLKYGHYCEWQTKLFSEHESYLNNFYPKQTPQQQAMTIYPRLKNQTAMVAVFDDPTQPLRKQCFDNPASAKVASAISSMVQRDHHWRLLTKVESPKGVLAIYQSTQLAMTSEARLRSLATRTKTIPD